MLSTRTGLSPAMARLSRRFRFLHDGHWPLPRSLATTSGVSVDVLSSGYLDVSVPRVRFPSLWIRLKIPQKVAGCPIRKFRDQRSLASPPDLSQRATSFIASRRQGIHQMPFITSSHPTPATDPRVAPISQQLIGARFFPCWLSAFGLLEPVGTDQTKAGGRYLEGTVADAKPHRSGCERGPASIHTQH